MDKREYTRRVVSVMCHLTAAEITAIRAEIEAHIEDRMEPLLALEGVDEAEAERRSIAAMGDPETVGRELQKHYSYFWLWVDRVVLGLLVLVIFGSGLLLPDCITKCWDNVTTRLAPMHRLLGEMERSWVDRELEMKASVGTDILHIYAVGTGIKKEEAVARVFWCAYDRSVLGRTGTWSFYYEDCRGQRADFHQGTAGVSGGQGACDDTSEVTVMKGDPYLTAVVDRYGERITLEIPLTWEETQ